MPAIRANGIRLEYDTLGDPAAPAILLIMGFAFQMTRWPEGFRRGLAEAGHRVIWFDNRDIGLSQDLSPDLSGSLTPLVRSMMQATLTGQAPGAVPVYTLDTMAADAAGLLDGLGIEQADVLGISMGGMIAQLMALNHPGKVRRLIPVMTSSGAPGLPPPQPAAAAALAAVPPVRTPEAIADIAVLAQTAIGSVPELRNSEAAIRANAIADFHRSDRPMGMARQYAAILTQPRWHDRLETVPHPTLVLHGEADPLIRPECGADIARRIPGARFRSFPGWGHDLVETMTPALLGEIIPFLKS